MLKVTVAIDMSFMNQHETLVQLKYIFTVLLKNKKSHLMYILDGMRVNKLTADFRSWVKHTFKTTKGEAIKQIWVSNIYTIVIPVTSEPH